MKSMTKFLIPLLALGSCNYGEVDRFPPDDAYDAVIWVNGSDHTIRMTAQGGRSLDITLAPGEQYRYDFDADYVLYPHTPLETCGFDQLDVYFDENIHVPYRQEPAENGKILLMPPADYSSPINLSGRERYSGTERVEWPVAIITWIYTFTDADYEAAKEWAEKQ